MTGDRRIGGGICSGMAAERQPFPAARPAVRRRIRCAGKASGATSSRHLRPGRPGAGHRHYVTVTNLMCKGRGSGGSGGRRDSRTVTWSRKRRLALSTYRGFGDNSCRGDAGRRLAARQIKKV
jgi:hypothetical protein